MDVRLLDVRLLDVRLLDVRPSSELPQGSVLHPRLLDEMDFNVEFTTFANSNKAASGLGRVYEHCIDQRPMTNAADATATHNAADATATSGCHGCRDDCHFQFVAIAALPFCTTRGGGGHAVAEEDAAHKPSSVGGGIAAT